MPFAEERIRVARLLEPLGDGHVLGAELPGKLGWLRAIVFREKHAGQMCRQPNPRWRLAGQHRASCRRTNRCRRIGRREPHALLRQPIQVRRLHQLVPLKCEVHPSKIIGHDEQNVWLGVGSEGANRCEDKKKTAHLGSIAANWRGDKAEWLRITGRRNEIPARP